MRIVGIQEIIQTSVIVSFALTSTSAVDMMITTMIESVYVE